MTRLGSCGEILPGQAPLYSNIRVPVSNTHIPAPKNIIYTPIIIDPPDPPNRPVIIPPIDPDPIRSNQQGSTTTTGVIIDPPGTQPPVTGWKCYEQIINCDPPNERYIRSATRTCIPCIVTPNDPACVRQTQQQCLSNCPPITTPVGCPNEVSLPQTQTSNNQKTITIPQVQFETNIATQTGQANVVVNTQTNYIKNAPQVLSNLLLNNNIYSPKYNFFKLNESVPTTYTQLVRNTVRNDIFSELVTEEVFHVLNSVRTNSPWSELTVQRLTLDKIEVSLNPEFLRSLKSIRYLNGEPVEKSNFLEAIKRHLLTGTLNEVDVGYYDTLARAQARSEINTYVLPETYQQKQKVALSKLILESVPADSGKYSDLTKQIIRRQRRLNEDINTKCYACTLENETKSLMIPNAGICVTTTSNGNFNIENSPGDGYYLYLNTVDRGCIPYRYETDVSAALMAPPEVRYGALKIAGIDPDLHLIAESTSSNHEFVAGHTAEVTFEPIYFKLDLSSVSSTPTLNPVIDNITATFSVLQTQEEIDEHTDNNALTVTRVFVDYRDPIYRYAKESGKLSFSQNDINLRSLTERLGNELILTRNVPFGIILVPSRGSQFNPFNSTSKITSLEDTVTRDIALMPSINLVDTKYSSPFLNVNKLYDLEMDRVGIAEPVDVEGGTFRYVSSSPYFRNTLYDGSRYTSSIDSVSSYGTSYLVKDVLDYLITTYSPSEISWFDVFRRMPLNKFGELMYDISEDVLLKLAEGYRGNIKIKNILDRFDADSKVLNDDDKCIIKKYDRI